MPTANTGVPAQLIGAFSEQAVSILRRRTKTEIEVRSRAALPGELKREADFLDWAQPLNLSPAPIWTGAPRETWDMIGRALGDTTTEEAEREEWTRFMGEVLTALAQVLAERLGTAVEAGAGSEALPGDADQLWRVDFDLPSSSICFFVGLPPALVQTVEGLSGSGAPKLSAASMELLLDVELPLSVSFGRTFLPVRDILRLSTGSVVELNRHVNDYVDVIVNNCVIARGEVVVIEGNYGIRVHEIVSRRERAMLQHMNRYAPIQSDMKASA